MKLQEISWPEAKAYFAENDTVIIGVGSCENHGMHLPLGTDALIPERLIAMIEEKTRVLSAPMLPFGSCDYFSGFPGTISLGDQVLTGVLSKIAKGLFQAGARHFVFVNGHGGNIPAIEAVCYELSKAGALSAVMNWWLMAPSFDPAWAGGHGGGQETSAIMYIRPELVNKAAMQPCDIADVSANIKAKLLKTAEFRGIPVSMPRDCAAICDNGWVGPDSLEQASPEQGEAMLVTIAAFIADFIEEFKTAPLPKAVAKSW